MKSWVTDWHAKATQGLDDKEVDQFIGEAESILDTDFDSGFGLEVDQERAGER